MAARLEESASRSVTYLRGADSVSINATPNSTEYKVDDEEGFSLRLPAWEWTITAADLVLAGSLVTPVRGDIIRETVAGSNVDYEVAALSDDIPEWKYQDTSRVLLLVRTKRVT